MEILKTALSYMGIAAVTCAGMFFVSQDVVADECRLSIVLDRTGSMGDAEVPTSKCAIGLDFAIGVVKGFINGDDVRIISSENSLNPLAPVVNSGFYTNKCLLKDRRIEIITISDATSFPAAPKNFTGGFVAPSVALSQLQTLQITDGAGTSSCSGFTQIADALCIAASNLRAEIPYFSDYRKMEIITDGGDNSSYQEPITRCDANLSEWIQETANELFFGGVSIVFDSTLFTDTFFSRAVEMSDSSNKVKDEISGLGQLSLEEQKFFTSLSLNTGGDVDLIMTLDDVAGTFITPEGKGIDVCDGDLDKDFNSPTCIIKP